MFGISLLFEPTTVLRESDFYNLSQAPVLIPTYGISYMLRQGKAEVFIGHPPSEG